MENVSLCSQPFPLETVSLVVCHCCRSVFLETVSLVVRHYCRSVSLENMGLVVCHCRQSVSLENVSLGSLNTCCCTVFQSKHCPVMLHMA